MRYTDLRAIMLVLADDEDGFGVVRLMPDRPIMRLNQATNKLEPYPRQQRRAREREDANPPRLSPRLEKVLPDAVGLGIFFSAPKSAVTGKRYRRFDVPMFPGETRKPSADYSTRYQALFTVHAGAEVHP